MTADLPPIQRLAAGGDFTLEVSVHNGRLRRRGRAGVHRRGYAVPTARGKRGQGHRMVPLPPLDSPKPSFALTHRRCAAKQKRGLGSGRQAAFGTLSSPEVAALSAAHNSARPDGAGRLICAAKGSVSIKRCALEHQTLLWAPRILDARPKGVASRRSGVKRGRNHVWCPVPFCPPPWARRPPPPKAAMPRPPRA